MVIDDEETVNIRNQPLAEAVRVTIDRVAAIVAERPPPAGKKGAIVLDFTASEELVAFVRDELTRRGLASVCDVAFAPPPPMFFFVGSSAELDFYLQRYQRSPANS